MSPDRERGYTVEDLHKFVDQDYQDCTDVADRLDRYSNKVLISWLLEPKNTTQAIMQLRKELEKYGRLVDSGTDTYDSHRIMISNIAKRIVAEIPPPDETFQAVYADGNWFGPADEAAAAEHDGASRVPNQDSGPQAASSSVKIGELDFDGMWALFAPCYEDVGRYKGVYTVNKIREMVQWFMAQKHESQPIVDARRRLRHIALAKMINPAYPHTNVRREMGRVAALIKKIQDGVDA